ncbi:MAG: threonine--tRNA ligase [Candidatus Aenigmarchaeota archaeon]|nr:threonine--tRNA ligase [Candidatus Aenigmarchaeota archaeon]
MNEYMIYTPEDELFDVEEFSYGENSDLKCLVDKEVLSKSSGETSFPRNLPYLKKFGIDWEEMSDKGHMRYQPKAALMFDLISDYAWDKATSLNIPIYRIRGTNMFKLSEPAVREHAVLFGDRLYQIEDEKEKYILRYAACHQQFAAIKHWNISVRHLPFGVYENADSYRLEQSGELLLGFRTRRMNMPDLHIISKNIEESKKISVEVHKKILEEYQSNLGRNLVNIYNLTESFFNENREYMKDLLKIEQKPVLLRFVPSEKYYWVINVEHHIIDSVQKPREIATFQIDIGNAKRFGIKYKNGSTEIYPPIIHTALIGTIERYLYTLFDTAAIKAMKGEAPTLPLWVAPTQVRVIPVSEKYNEFAFSIGKKLYDNMIRTEIDDRDESVGKKVSTSEKDWVNYTLVAGEREKTTGLLSIRDRCRKEMKNMSLEEFIKSLQTEIGNKPKIKPYFPIQLSKIPPFV